MSWAETVRPRKSPHATPTPNSGVQAFLAHCMADPSLRCHAAGLGLQGRFHGDLSHWRLLNHPGQGIYLWGVRLVMVCLSMSSF